MLRNPVNAGTNQAEPLRQRAVLLRLARELGLGAEALVGGPGEESRQESGEG